ncbi:MAG: ATP-binding cassette domain-containing protein [Rhodobacterales bacterium]|nr:ATP-binding cassette domain-containing protein [Rhodobacterales bacterium]
MIEFQGVSKSFWTGKQRKVILDRASFRVDLGNSMGILAENGAGKTTIINMMAGLEKPDEGVIRKTSRVSFPLGFMGGVSSRHSAHENCRSIARLYGLDPDYVESFCDIYLIDEGMPATADVEFNRKAGNILKERLKTATVVIVSHSPATLQKFCRSAAVLRHGKLYQFETLEEAKRLYDYQA